MCPDRLKVPWQFKSAFALGVSATLANLLSLAIAPFVPIPIGCIFLFVAAQALGLRGALVAANVAIILEVFLPQGMGQPIAIARCAFECLALGLVNTKFPRIAPFALVLVIWGFVYVPLLSLGEFFHLLPFHLDSNSLVSALIVDTIAALIAGTFLLNPTIWAWVARRPRVYSLAPLLIHVLALVAVITAAIFWMLTNNSSAGIRGAQIPPLSLTLLVTLAFSFPIVVGWRLCSVISRLARELFMFSLVQPSSFNGFSGLSSDYWRRRNNASNDLYTQEVRTSEMNQTDLGPLGDLSDYGVCAVDSCGTVTFANRKFVKLTRPSKDTVIGMKLDTIGLHPTLQSHLTELLVKSSTFKEQTSELKLNELPNNLRFFEIRSINAEGLSGSSLGGVQGVIFTVKDITNRRAIESSLLKSQRLATLGQLVTGICHSFSNALIAITGNADIANKTSDRQERNESLNAIIQTVNRASSWIKTLLDYASGGPASLRSVDLKAIINEHLPLVRELVGEDITLEMCANPGMSFGIRCDPNLVIQALTNLISNSRDAYDGKCGTVEISMEVEEIDAQVSHLHIGARPGKFVRLRVKDNGTGMTPEVLSRAFDPLFTTKRSLGGNGLGLSTVFSIVRAHDGFLTAESTPNSGTSISLYFPHVEISDPPIKSDSTSSIQDPTAQSSSDHSINAKKILVVEDEEIIRNLIQSILTKAGYSVSAFGEAKSALQFCENEGVDLVILDMVLPNMSGQELISELKAVKNCHPKMVIMSGYGRTSSSLEEDIVLPKPFDVDTLLSTVNRALGVTPGCQE